MTRKTSSATSRWRGLAVLVVATTLALAGTRVATARPNNAPRMFSMNYCWGTGWPSFSICPQASLALYSNHIVVATDMATGGTGSGAWDTARRDTEISFTFPGATYVGTRVSPNCYQGTMTSPNVYGGGTWAGCFAS